MQFLLQISEFKLSLTNFEHEWQIVFINQFIIDLYNLPW